MATSEESCDGNPDFAVICSFITRFGDDCGVNITIPDLQQMLEDTKNVHEDLSELHIHLLRRGRKRVTKERWEKSLIKFCHEYSSVDAWELERFGYKKAKLSVKLELLKRLLELQFDANPKFKAEINKNDAEALRVPPVGRDIDGQCYWYQLDKEYNMRLYRQGVGDENIWQLLCSTTDHLKDLLASLEKFNTKHVSAEKSLKDTSEDKDGDEADLKIETSGSDLKAHISETKPYAIIIKTEKKDLNTITNAPSSEETIKKDPVTDKDSQITTKNEALEVSKEPEVKNEEKPVEKMDTSEVVIKKEVCSVSEDVTPMQIDDSKNAKLDAPSTAKSDVEMIDVGSPKTRDSKQVPVEKEHLEGKNLEENTTKSKDVGNCAQVTEIKVPETECRGSKFKLYEKWSNEKKQAASAAVQSTESSKPISCGSVTNHKEQTSASKFQPANLVVESKKSPESALNKSKLSHLSSSVVGNTSSRDDAPMDLSVSFRSSDPPAKSTAEISPTDLSASSKKRPLSDSEKTSRSYNGGNERQSPFLPHDNRKIFDKNCSPSEAPRPFKKKHLSKAMEESNMDGHDLARKSVIFEVKNNKLFNQYQENQHGGDAVIKDQPLASSSGFSHLQALQNMCNDNPMTCFQSSVIHPAGQDRRLNSDGGLGKFDPREKSSYNEAACDSLSKKYKFNYAQLSGDVKPVPESVAPSPLLKSNVCSSKEVPKDDSIPKTHSIASLVAVKKDAPPIDVESSNNESGVVGNMSKTIPKHSEQIGRLGMDLAPKTLSSIKSPKESNAKSDTENYVALEKHVRTSEPDVVLSNISLPTNVHTKQESQESSKHCDNSSKESVVVEKADFKVSKKSSEKGNHSIEKIIDKSSVCSGSKSVEVRQKASDSTGSSEVPTKSPFVESDKSKISPTSVTNLGLAASTTESGNEQQSPKKDSSNIIKYSTNELKKDTGDSIQKSSDKPVIPSKVTSGAKKESETSDQSEETEVSSSEKVLEPLSKSVELPQATDILKKDCVVKSGKQEQNSSNADSVDNIKTVPSTDLKDVPETDSKVSKSVQSKDEVQKASAPKNSNESLPPSKTSEVKIDKDVSVEKSKNSIKEVETVPKTSIDDNLSEQKKSDALTKTSELVKCDSDCKTPSIESTVPYKETKMVDVEVKEGCAELLSGTVISSEKQKDETNKDTVDSQKPESLKSSAKESDKPDEKTSSSFVKDQKDFVKIVKSQPTDKLDADIRSDPKEIKGADIKSQDKNSESKLTVELANSKSGQSLNCSKSDTPIATGDKSNDFKSAKMTEIEIAVSDNKETAIKPKCEEKHDEGIKTQEVSDSTRENASLKLDLENKMKEDENKQAEMDELLPKSNVDCQQDEQIDILAKDQTKSETAAKKSNSEPKEKVAVDLKSEKKSVEVVKPGLEKKIEDENQTFKDASSKEKGEKIDFQHEKDKQTSSQLDCGSKNLVTEDKSEKVPSNSTGKQTSEPNCGNKKDVTIDKSEKISSNSTGKQTLEPNCGNKKDVTIDKSEKISSNSIGKQTLEPNCENKKDVTKDKSEKISSNSIGKQTLEPNSENKKDVTKDKFENISSNSTDKPISFPKSKEAVVSLKGACTKSPKLGSDSSTKNSEGTPLETPDKESVRCNKSSSESICDDISDSKKEKVENLQEKDMPDSTKSSEISSKDICKSAATLKSACEKAVSSLEKKNDTSLKKDKLLKIDKKLELKVDENKTTDVNATEKSDDVQLKSDETSLKSSTKQSSEATTKDNSEDSLKHKNKLKDDEMAPEISDKDIANATMESKKMDDVITDEAANKTAESSKAPAVPKDSFDNCEKGISESVSNLNQNKKKQKTSKISKTQRNRSRSQALETKLENESKTFKETSNDAPSIEKAKKVDKEACKAPDKELRKPKVKDGVELEKANVDDVAHKKDVEDSLDKSPESKEIKSSSSEIKESLKSVKDASVSNSKAKCDINLETGSKLNVKDPLSIYFVMRSRCRETKFTHLPQVKSTDLTPSKVTPKPNLITSFSMDVTEEMEMIHTEVSASPVKKKRGRLRQKEPDPKPVENSTPPKAAAAKTPANSRRQRAAAKNSARTSAAAEKDSFTIPEGFLEILSNSQSEGRSVKKEPQRKSRGRKLNISAPSLHSSESESAPIKRSSRIQAQHEKKMSELAVEMEREQRMLELLAKKTVKKIATKTPPPAKAKEPKVPKAAKSKFEPPTPEETCMETKRTTRKMNSRSRNMTKMTLMYEDESKDSEFSTSRETEKSKKRRRGRGSGKKGYKPWDLSSESSSSLEELTEEEEEEEEPEEQLVFEVNEDEFACEEVEEDAVPIVVRRARTAKKASEDQTAEETVVNDDKPCCNCGKFDKPEWILLCDKCDNGYHTHCLKPPLTIIPDGDWYCQPCEHMFLCEWLQKEVHDLELVIKQREREELRKQRLAYVGISLDNVLKPDKKEKSDESSKEEESEVESKGGRSRESSEDERHKKLYGKRSVRARRNVNYQFKEYDALIASAIQEELIDVKLTEDEDEEFVEGDKHKATDKPFKAKISRRKRKKSSRLNDLDFSEEDIDSGEEYKGSSSDSEQNALPSSNESDGESAASGEWRIVKTKGKGKKKPKRGKRRGSSDEEWDENDSDTYRPVTRRAAQKNISYRELSSDDEWTEQPKQKISKKRKKESSSEDSEASFKKKKPKRKSRVRKWASSDTSEESERSMSFSGNSSQQSEDEWKIKKSSDGSRIKININKKVLSSEEEEENESSQEPVPKKQPPKAVSDEEESEEEEEGDEDEEEEESSEEEEEDEDEEEESEEETKPAPKPVEKPAVREKEPVKAELPKVVEPPKPMAKTEVKPSIVPPEPAKSKAVPVPVRDKAPAPIRTVKKDATKMVPCVIPYDKSPKSGHGTNPDEESDKEVAKEKESVVPRAAKVLPFTKTMPQAAPKPHGLSTSVARPPINLHAVDRRPFKSTIIQPFSNIDDDGESDDEVPLERIPTSVPTPTPSKAMGFEREAEYTPVKELAGFSYTAPEEKCFPPTYSPLAPFQDYSSRPSPLKPSLVETYSNNSSPSKLTPLDSYSQTSSPKGFISLDSYSESRKKKQHFYGNPASEPEALPRSSVTDSYQGGEIRFPPEPYPCSSSPGTYPPRSPPPHIQRDPGTPPRLYSQYPDNYAPPRSPDYYQNHQYYPPEERVPRPAYQPNYVPSEPIPPFVTNPYVATPVPQPNGGFMIDTLLRARNPENEEDELTEVTDIVSYITQE